MKDWLAERVLLEEVPESRRAEVAAARGSDALDETLASLRESSDEILASLAPSAVAAEVRRRAAAGRAQRQRRVVMWTAPIAAAAAVLLLVVLRPTATEPVPESGVRSKGDARLEFYRKVGDGSARVRPTDSVREGDRLQVSYVASGARFGVILSVDGRGAVTVHHPATGTTAAPLEQSGAKALRFGYELDDAPRFERFFFVTANEPFDVAVPVRAATRLAEDLRRAESHSLTLPADLAQATYVFRKRGTTP